MSHSHTLTPDSEFRYIVSWFREFSEYEKADFMAILIQWLLKPNEIYVNGMTDSMASKPMSLFSCRVRYTYQFSHCDHISTIITFFVDQAIQRLDTEMAERVKIKTDR